VGQGMTWTAAARHAGYKSPGSLISVWNADPRMAAIVREEQRKNAEAAQMTRQKVMDGFLEAVSMAKLLSDPHALIKAWAEIAKMCGYYAPEVKKIDISIAAKRVASQMERLTDDELLKLAEKELVAVGLDIVDAEIISESIR